jgi:KaiC/GvpD/RAD55 family RecA-like ATPase
MGSVFEDLQNKFDGKPVLFVTLDFTNVTLSNHANLMGAALGIGPAMEENKGTGFILLIDGKTKKVLSTLTSDMDFKQMAKAIDEALGKG